MMTSVIALHDYEVDIIYV